MSYGKEIASAFAAKIKSEGYKTYLAKSGTHGYFTDKSGTRVISFEQDLLHVTFSGNYAPTQKAGSGWRMAEISETKQITKPFLDRLFFANPPCFCSGHGKLSTQEDHKKRYQESSLFVEV